MPKAGTAVGIGSDTLLAEFLLIMKMQIELQPWQTPNFVIGTMPPRSRQEGFNPDACPKWSLAETDADVLAKQCDQFRAGVFRKAGKPDPANVPGQPRPWLARHVRTHRA